MNIHTCMYIYTCVYTCMYIHINIYIYIHTCTIMFFSQLKLIYSRRARFLRSDSITPLIKILSKNKVWTEGLISKDDLLC